MAVVKDMVVARLGGPMDPNASNLVPLIKPT
jgi:hypothetical protein